VVVPKHGHENVERNKLKRWLKELGRTCMLPTLWGRDCQLDVLLRARREAYGAEYAELKEEVEAVLEEACSGERSSG
jgi:RNase P protein component